jgi:hypothetical protein
MKRNRRLLLKTAKRIEKIPESYDQKHWATDSSSSPCGTAACLAGELIICSARSVRAGVTLLRNRYTLPDFISTPHMASKLAGLTEEEANKLFPEDVDEWPAQFRKRYVTAKTKQDRANAAAALLRYLAAGGAV